MAEIVGKEKFALSHGDPSLSHRGQDKEYQIHAFRPWQHESSADTALEN